MVAGYNPLNPDPNDPWWIPGWTSQNRATVPTTPPPPPPPFPTDIPQVTITETYIDATPDGMAGIPLEGGILIRPNATFHDEASGTEVVPRVRRYPLVNGVLTMTLPAFGPEVSYTLREAFPGGQQYAITIPTTATGTVTLHSLIDPQATIIPIETMPPMYGWQYPATQ